MKWRGISATESEPVKASLREELAERRALMRHYVPPATLEINDRVTQELKSSGMLERVLARGARAPEFSLPDADGALLASAELLARGPLVISFLRGRWCPFCIAEAEALDRALPEIHQAGAALVAISPQDVRQTGFMREQHKLRYPLLSDSGSSVGRQFGLVYGLPDYQQELFQSVFINLPFINSDPAWELPLPATYILNSDGAVRWRWVSADYTERAEPDEVIAALRAP
ncbi:MAG TPA: peroxiredoxin-like family protein [Terriglobales bacterium]|nr:peroxiredoxin-like family protein [Terriglobales bacterium]